MFAVDGWSLPNVVPQKAERKRKEAPGGEKPVPNSNKKQKPDSIRSKAPTPSEKKTPKDKSKYTPYGKDKKGSSGSNVVPVAKERRPRPKSPSPVAPPASTKQSSHSSYSANGKDDKKPRPKERKPLARPPRSERDATPPKLHADVPPPSFSGLASSRHLTPLQLKMAAKLSGARFRWINEHLYTTTGADALALITEKPEMFEAYHAGFREQVRDWPANPIDTYKARLESMVAAGLEDSTTENRPLGVTAREKQRSPPPRVVMVDLGCGEAAMATHLDTLDPHRRSGVELSSFDLLATNDHVTACDIAHLPLPDASVDVALFCLSLMGTDFLLFLAEAARVLRPGTGRLWISEIKSRFGDRDAGAFVRTLEAMGFTLVARDDANKMFINLDFVRGKDKVVGDKKTIMKQEQKSKKKKPVAAEGEEHESLPLPSDNTEPTRKIGTLLKPCTYKRR